jgi:hypothetical protein
MTFEEKKEIAAILKTMGVVMRGHDKADEGPNTLQDLRNIHTYILGLQELLTSLRGSQ